MIQLKAMPRYVILRHQMPKSHTRTLHWDLMLEHDQVLLTWSLDSEPALPCRIQATALPEHRLAYLDYEGPISEDRGEVTRWDTGKLLELHCGDNRVTFQIAGLRLQASGILIPDSHNQRWWLELTDARVDILESG